MQVILLEKIEKLGQFGDKVEVKAGFARNFLIPKGKAVMATPANLASFEERRAELKAKSDALLAKAQERAAQIRELGAIEIAVLAGEDGKLFGSVSSKDIALAVTEKGIAIKRAEVRLAEGALRAVGEYQVKIHLHSEVDAILAVNIVNQ